MQLGGKWIPPKTGEKPWIHHLFRRNTNLPSPVRVGCPFTSVGWKNLHLTKTREDYKVNTSKIWGWDNPPSEIFRKLDAVKFHHPFRNLTREALQSAWSRPVRHAPGHHRLISLEGWLSLPARAAQSSTAPTHGTKCGLTRVNRGQMQEKDLEVAQWKI